MGAMLHKYLGWDLGFGMGWDLGLGFGMGWDMGWDGRGGEGMGGDFKWAASIERVAYTIRLDLERRRALEEYAVLSDGKAIDVDVE
ncbi:hypothetical protein C1646_753502 [Rhizophagus diaphanus]|nr:hypothetical protein C1646_753502 [Rhizophagus diaphanus] [Rhizophagus sp. MUCL 43196]